MTTATFNSALISLGFSNVSEMNIVEIEALAKKNRISANSAAEIVRAFVAQGQPEAQKDEEEMEETTNRNTVMNETFTVKANENVSLAVRIVTTRGAFGKTGKGTGHITVRPSNWNHKKISVRLYGQDHRQNLHIVQSYSNSLTGMYAGLFSTVSGTLVLKETADKYMMTASTANRQGYMRLMANDCVPDVVSIPGEYQITPAQREDYRREKVETGVTYTLDVKGGRLVLGERADMPAGIEWLVRKSDGSIVTDDDGHSMIDDNAAHAAQTVQKAAFPMALCNGYEIDFQVEPGQANYIATILSMDPEDAKMEILGRLSAHIAKDANRKAEKNLTARLYKEHETEELANMPTFFMVLKDSSNTEAVKTDGRDVIGDTGIKGRWFNKGGFPVPGTTIITADNVAAKFAYAQERGYNLRIVNKLQSK